MGSSDEERLLMDDYRLLIEDRVRIFDLQSTINNPQQKSTICNWPGGDASVHRE
jgi:hypothetical protein